jgi:hypothetical protein
MCGLSEPIWLLRDALVRQCRVVLASFTFLSISPLGCVQACAMRSVAAVSLFCFSSSYSLFQSVLRAVRVRYIGRSAWEKQAKRGK